jgi:riboflavin kinase/FMN adenylyltransferase
MDQARREALAGVAVTFNPHPRSVLRPGAAVTYLTSLEERVELLLDLGLDAVAVLSFTSELAQLSPPEFVALLCQELHMKLLVVGPDFALGRNREGTIGALREMGRDQGFRVEVAGLLDDDGEKVGSSSVRHALARGDLEAVQRLLGHPFSLRGPVVTGASRGRSIGFPTANIALGLDRALPAFGVYVTRAHVREVSHPSCTNVGVRPTFDAELQPTVETYILDLDEDLYGREIRLDLLHRLRGELKFDSVDDLVSQIRRDIQATRDFFCAG